MTGGLRPEDPRPDTAGAVDPVAPTPPTAPPAKRAGGAASGGAGSGGERTGRFAALIALGILASRVFGFVRQGVFSGFFGAGPIADAYNAALRIPNLLQNLLGEGVLSASFIPVYAGLLSQGERERADRLAGAVAALLALATAALVLLGMLAAPLLVAQIASGFDAPTRALTVRLTRIVFPGIGLLVGSAWCLGILNSHRRFLLSYLAPVAWNVVIIATLLWWGGRRSTVDLAVIAAWGAVAGCALQLVVQLPSVRRHAPHLRLSLAAGDPDVRAVTRTFLPVVIGRGVVQLSAYIDTRLASLVMPGAFTILLNAQSLYLLPGSLFGMSISAAELPAMAGLQGQAEEVALQLRTRLGSALRRMAFFVVPSAAAFLSAGDVIAAAVFGYGRFTEADVNWVWGTLAGSTVGLLAATLGRLYASTFYALRDTRTPLRFALVRVLLNLVLGYAAVRHGPRLLGIDQHWGTACLTAVSGIAGWVEYGLLRQALARRIGPTGIPTGALLRLWGASVVAAAAGWGVRLLLGGTPALVAAAVVCGVFGAVYLATTALLGEGESAALLGRVRRRFVGPR